MLSYRFVTLAALVLVLLAATPSEAAHEGVTLPALLTSKPEYSTLVELLTFADLVTALTPMMNITIFAPTNFGFLRSAMEIGCEDTSDQMAVIECFKALGMDTLALVLKYHVVPSLLSSEMVLMKNKFNTLAGVTFNRRGLRLNDQNEDTQNPKLIQSKLDSRYQYGYVHGINKVLMLNMDGGSDEPTLVELLEMKGKYKILLHFLDMMDLTETVSNMKGLTIFAPADRAFMKTSMALGCEDATSYETALECIHDLLDDDMIMSLVKYHVTNGLFPSEKLMATNVLKMFNDVFLYRHKSAFIDQAPGYPNAYLAMDAADMRYDNGIVHGIGRVLIPFRTLMPDDVCENFEFPVSLADTSYLPLFKIIIGTRQCSSVLTAIEDCDVSSDSICSDRRGSMMAEGSVTVGEAVAAAKQCNDVALALKACKQAL